MALRFCLLILCSSLSSSILCFVDTSQDSKISLNKIETLIERGKYDAAIFLTESNLRKSPNKNSNDAYQLYILASKVYFFQERMTDFLHASEEAFKIKRKSNRIYKAYYFAQKAAYFHYYMLADSSVYFADNAMKILKQNWKERKKVFYPFIYHQYANAFMYRKSSYANTGSLEGNQRLYLKNICSFLDSAYYHATKLKCLPQDISLIHRTKANRMMDIIGYKIRTHEQAEVLSSHQKSLFSKVINEYNKALKLLHRSENNFRTQLLALKALAYFSVGKISNGDEILWPLIKKYDINNIEKIYDHLNSSLYVLQYYTEFLLSKGNLDKRIFSVIEIYEKLIPFWDATQMYFNNGSNIYGNSPYVMLSFIYERLLKSNQNNQVILDKIALFALENYRIYSFVYRTNKTKFNKAKFRRFLFGLETKDEVKKFDISDYFRNKSLGKNELLLKIQSQLRDREALLIQTRGMFGREGLLLIEKNHIHFDSSALLTPKIPENINSFNIKEYKHESFKLLKYLPFRQILQSNSIKKLYVTIDFSERFNYVITDTTGSDFYKLSFLKKKINIIRIFNPIDFFTNSSFQITEYFHPFVLDKSPIQRLPFSENLIQKRRKIFEQNIHPKLPIFSSKELKNPGILHILGHGRIKTDENSGWQSSHLQVNHFKSNKILDPVRSDLILLNICYGSIGRQTFLPDRDLHNNLISRGAKAVIASPYQTVDQSSAYIFEKFYAYLDKGITVEDALQKAKLDYLKTHKGSLAHPMYWSTYELTSNVKDLRLAPKKRPLPWVWIPMLSLIIGVTGSLWWCLRR